ncbi:MAG: ester cyclase, partial [Candidatus Puniceispirillum sp.]
MTSQHSVNKDRIKPFRKAMYDFTPDGVSAEIAALFAPDAIIHMAHPFETLAGPDALMAQALMPLYQAFPDLERRDYLVMAGVATNDDGASDWVGCCGYYTGTFMAPFLDIPPTGHQASMRFHEFYRFEDGKVVEMQSLWDIPEIMMQAGVWPMSPSMGREWLVPAPATADGLFLPAWTQDSADASVKLVLDMLTGLGKFATSGAAAMELERYWHPHFSWYGPSGIGTGRGI